MFRQALQDARYSLRAMLNHPAFAVAAVTSLALGIGATTAIYSVASAVLLRSLPYRDPAQLASISIGGAITAPWFETFRREARGIEQAGLFVNSSFNMSGGGQPVRVQAARVSAGLFEMLGIAPQMGRTFTDGEDQRGHDEVVLISDGLWKSQFAGDPHTLGRTVILDGAPHTVIGIMPPGFQFPYGPELPDWAGSPPPADMWRPMALADWEQTCKGCFNFGMLARLRPGVDAAQARAELQSILERTDANYRNTPESPLRVLTLQDAVTHQVRTSVAILSGAVVLALLIVCVNVANLLLARGLQRQGEFALRLSLGATQWRLTRQMLTESLVLALCAGAVGVPLAWAGIRAIVAIAPSGIPRLGEVGLDGRVLAFACGVSLLSAVLFGTVPALLASRHAPGDALKAGWRAATAAPARLRAALVVAEVGLSLVLLVGAGLLAQSFANVARTPLGFHAENVLTMRMSFSGGIKPGDLSRARFVEQLTLNCASLPGTVSAAAVNTLPLTGESEGWGLVPEDDPQHYVMTRVRAITPAYFRTLGIRLVAGREFTAADRGGNPVIILSRTAARQLWPAATDPLGRRVGTKRKMTVVGIVDDTRASGLDNEVRPYLYLPFWQFVPAEFALAIRTPGDPATLAAAAKQEVWKLDKDLPVTHVAVMRQLVAASIAPRRFQAVLMTLFGVFALVLAAVGIYGVLAYSVTQRTHEFGIRLALGATGWQLLGSVFRQAGTLWIIGTAIGVAASVSLAPLLRGLLYGVAPLELSVYLGCALLLAAVAAAASLVPARRAAKLEPMICLRYE